VRRAPWLLLVLFASCSGPPEPQPARRLVVAYPAGPQSLDPNRGLHEEFASSVLANVYEGLVEVQPDLTVRPGLAESWHSPDDLSWVFVLRRGVRFHDGHLLTAADVVDSFGRARQDTWLAGELEPVVSVRAQGEHEVVFKTRTRFSALPARLTYFYVTGRARDGGTAAPGTGPYRVRSWSAAGPTVLEAFDGYRGGRPPIPEVEFRAIPDAGTRAELVRRHEVHLTMDIRPEDRAALAGVPGVEVAARPGLRVVFLGLDTVRKPFADRRVREAVALALDKEALVKGPLAGLAERTEQIPRPGEVGFAPALPVRPHDTGRARALLAEAGLAGGFEVALDYAAGKYLAIDAVAAEIGRQLGAVGIRVGPRPTTPNELITRVEARDTRLFLLGWLNETGSAHETYGSLLATPGEDAGATNGSGWSHPGFDRLLADVARESDNDRRGLALRKATQLVYDELPVIPLYCQQDLYAFSAQLAFEPSLYRRIVVARLRFEE
jgi:peptide/nickel transport system substrate-binding protein